VRHDPVCIMIVHATAGRLLALRASLGGDAASFVEEVDPFDLSVRHASGPLRLGPFWPGGVVALAGGSCLVVQGRHAHRLDADLTLAAHRQLPHDAPYNSFVALPDGTIVTKDLRRPGEPASTVSTLDPVTLEDRSAAFELPEPCVARLSASGDEVIAVGVSALHRLRWDPQRGVLEPCAEPLVYANREDQSFGWDPVVTEAHVWWMDNGDHRFQNGLTMLGNGVSSGAVRLWRATRNGDELESVAISGRPNGAITNPPLVDQRRRIVLAYDSANGVLAAFDTHTMSPRWSAALATAQHLVLFADSGEVIANHFEPGVGDSLVVIDIESGHVRCRVPIGSPAQSVVFCTPGVERDAYYVSLTTMARIEFSD
jgi:hypothetical protein